MEVDVPAPAEEAGQLFLISPPRRRPQGVIDLAVEERVCLCLAKFAPVSERVACCDTDALTYLTVLTMLPCAKPMQRAKLGFGPVTVGKLKTIIVEVSAPAARTAVSFDHCFMHGAGCATHTTTFSNHFILCTCWMHADPGSFIDFKAAVSKG